MSDFNDLQMKSSVRGTHTKKSLFQRVGYLLFQSRFAIRIFLIVIAIVIVIVCLATSTPIDGSYADSDNPALAVSGHISSQLVLLLIITFVGIESIADRAFQSSSLA